jgi:hypothetical protein
VADTGWFVPGRETTVITDSSGSGESQLFQALQALNPPYDINRRRPFADHPDLWSQGPYVRKVIPKKKTAVFMVFSAGSQQVLELAKIDSDLIETDRIEVGRRLDYSRWITFVEISGASRWSEIAEEMRTLRADIAGRLNLPAAAQKDAFLDAFFEKLQGTDRLKGAVADRCLDWLEAIGPFIPAGKRDIHQRCLHGVRRAQRFTEARNVAAAMLPLTICLHPGHGLRSGYDFPDIFSAVDQQNINPVLSLLRLVCERFSPGETGDEQESLLAEAMSRVAPSLQVFQEVGLGRIGIRGGRQRLHLDGLKLGSGLEQRLSLIAVTCLLAELAKGHRPLLLLDGFDRGLSAAEIPKLAASLQRIGRVYQLLTSAADKEMAGEPGWQSVLRAGAGGLEAARLESV